MRFLLLSTLLVFLCLSCLDEDDRTGIRIRVENRTAMDLLNVELEPVPGELMVYGNLPAGLVSTYRFADAGDHCQLSWTVHTATNDTLAGPEVHCRAIIPIPPGNYRMIFDSLPASTSSDDQVFGFVDFLEE